MLCAARPVRFVPRPLSTGLHPLALYRFLVRVAWCVYALPWDPFLVTKEAVRDQQSLSQQVLC